MSFLFPQPQAPSADTKLANLDEDQMATNQEAIPAPWFCGQARLAAKWICDVLRRTSTPIKEKVGKGSASTTGYNYYGDIAGLFCCGPVDEVTKIYSDNEEVWSGSLERGQGPESDMQILSHAEARFHWGTDDQPRGTLVLNRMTDEVFTFSPDRQPWEYAGIDPENPDEIPAAINEYANLAYEHPAYRGFFYVELRKFFFGQNRTTVPNFELLLRRAPRVAGINLPTEIEPSGCNPVTALAELITNPRFGLGRDVSILDTASWQATAAALEDNKSFYYISPCYTSGKSITAIVGEILGYFDGWIRPNKGKLEIGYFPHDGVVPEVRELSHLDVVDLPSIESPGYGDTVNSVQVRYKDRIRDMKESAETAFSSFNRRTVGELREKGLDRKFFITRQQAKKFAEEFVETASVPESSGEVVVRAERAVNLDGTKILPGDRFHLDDGHFEIDMIVRCTRRIEKPKKGTVSLSWIRERGLFAMDYSSPIDRPLVTQDPPAAITAGRVIELSSKWTESVRTHVAILAQRPASDVEFFNIWFSQEGTSYDMLIKQTDWALRGALAQDISYNPPPPAAPQENPESGRTSSALEEVDEETEIVITASGEDLVKLQPQSAQAKANNTLLLIVNDEIFSIGNVIAEGQGRYRISAFRHRLGTLPSIHTTGTEAWVATREEMFENAMSHSGFVDEARRWFKLQTGRIGAMQPLSEAYVIAYDFAGRPEALPVITFSSGNPLTAETGHEIHISGTIEDQNEDITGWTMSVITASGRQQISGESGLSTGEVVFNVPHKFWDPGWAYFEVTATDFENQQIGWSTARWPELTYIDVTGEPLSPIDPNKYPTKSQVELNWAELIRITGELTDKMQKMNEDFLDEIETLNGIGSEIRERVETLETATSTTATKLLQLGSKAGNNASAITELKETYADFEKSHAEDITALLSQLNEGILGAKNYTAQAVNGLRTDVGREYAKAQNLNELRTSVLDLTRSYSGLSSAINSTNTRVGDNEGTIEAMGNDVTSLTTWLNSHRTSVDLLLGTFIDEHGNLEAKATLEVNADGSIAGWKALAGTGGSELTFNADRVYFTIEGRKYQLRPYTGMAQIWGPAPSYKGHPCWGIKGYSIPVFRAVDGNDELGYGKFEIHAYNDLG